MESEQLAPIPAFRIAAMRKDGTVEVFQRNTQADAQALASKLDKDSLVIDIQINGQTFLNARGPDGLYLHLTGQCSVCRPLIVGHCERCKRATIDLNNDGGKVEGYRSIRPTHYHARAIAGELGHEGVHEILCYSCHRADRLSTYGPTCGETHEAPMSLLKVA